MAFEKGHSKIGGRTKGTPNMHTKQLRIALREVIEKELDNIPVYLSEIKDNRIKLELLIKLMPFVFPKMSAHSLNQMDDIDDGINPLEFRL